MKNTRADESRPEYRFDHAKAKPNRFAAQVRKGSVAVLLDPDVARVFQGRGVGECRPAGAHDNNAEASGARRAIKRIVSATRPILSWPESDTEHPRRRLSTARGNPGRRVWLWRCRPPSPMREPGPDRQANSTLPSCGPCGRGSSETRRGGRALTLCPGSGMGALPPAPQRV